jgi:hypothetical protein
MAADAVALADAPEGAAAGAAGDGRGKGWNGI